jgi:hypothetical protein
MSEGKFWTRSRARRESKPLAAVGFLTAADRCDRCGAQAYVRVLLPSRHELLFCGHHNWQHSSALAKIAVAIHDETWRLFRVAV